MPRIEPAGYAHIGACMQAREQAHLPTAMGMHRRWAIKWMCQLRCSWTESMSCRIATQRSQVCPQLVLTAFLLLSLVLHVLCRRSYAWPCSGSVARMAEYGSLADSRAQVTGLMMRVSVPGTATSPLCRRRLEWMAVAAFLLCRRRLDGWRYGLFILLQKLDGC